MRIVRTSYKGYPLCRRGRLRRTPAVPVYMISLAGFHMYVHQTSPGRLCVKSLPIVLTTDRVPVSALDPARGARRPLAEEDCAACGHSPRLGRIETCEAGSAMALSRMQRVIAHLCHPRSSWRALARLESTSALSASGLLDGLSWAKSWSLTSVAAEPLRRTSKRTASLPHFGTASSVRSTRAT